MMLHLLEAQEFRLSVQREHIVFHSALVAALKKILWVLLQTAVG